MTAWPRSSGRLPLARISCSLISLCRDSMDMRLPGDMREHSELRETVLVALTGYGQQSDRLKAIEAGFNEHITKPTTFETLKDLLRRLPAGRAFTTAAR